MASLLGCGATMLALVCTSASAALIDLTPTPPALNSNDSVSLASLIADPTSGVQVGDKLFTAFSYSRIGDMPAASDVLVLGFQDPSGNFGVSFHGAFIDLPGGGASDALVRFLVQVDPLQAQQGRRISDAHLSIGGVGVGENSAFIVDESFQERNETLNAFKSTLPPGGVQLSDDVIFGTPLVALHVTKDIFALAGEGSFLPARATVIDQSFSQVPEPASVALCGLTGLALASVTRRKS